MLLLLILKNKNYPIGFHFLWTFLETVFSAYSGDCLLILLHAPEHLPYRLRLLRGSL